MNPSICLVVGDQNTEHCGVKDYAHRLGAALGEMGLSVQVLAPRDWSVRGCLQFCRSLKRHHFDILHLQYPSIGNRKSICPHFLGLARQAKATVVTLHEYSSMPLTQRISTHLFRWSADALLFTAETELIRYGRASIRRQVIHIGSNVPPFASNQSRTSSVLYFGQIRPEKGIEAFLELARLSLLLKRPFRYRIIGSVPPRRMPYYKCLRAKSVSEVEWLTNLAPNQISRLMAGSIAAYLPFPDGASYRRGSLLAALTNGLPSITTVGQATPRDMIDVVLPATCPSEALTHLETLYRSPGKLKHLSDAGRVFAERFSWVEIAKQHVQVYLDALSRLQSSSQGMKTPESSFTIGTPS